MIRPAADRSDRQFGVSVIVSSHTLRPRADDVWTANVLMGAINSEINRSVSHSFRGLLCGPVRVENTIDSSHAAPDTFAEATTPTGKFNFFVSVRRTENCSGTSKSLYRGIAQNHELHGARDRPVTVVVVERMSGIRDAAYQRSVAENRSYTVTYSIKGGPDQPSL